MPMTFSAFSIHKVRHTPCRDVQPGTRLFPFSSVFPSRYRVLQMTISLKIDIEAATSHPLFQTLPPLSNRLIVVYETCVCRIHLALCCSVIGASVRRSAATYNAWSVNESPG